MILFLNCHYLSSSREQLFTKLRSKDTWTSWTGCWRMEQTWRRRTKWDFQTVINIDLHCNNKLTVVCVCVCYSWRPQLSTGPAEEEACQPCSSSWTKEPSSPTGTRSGPNVLFSTASPEGQNTKHTAGSDTAAHVLKLFFCFCTSRNTSNPTGNTEPP